MGQISFEEAKKLFASLGLTVDARYTPDVVQFVANCLKDANKLGKVAALELVKSQLVKCKLAQYQQCEPGRVGVSDKHRQGIGIVGNDSQWLGGRILDIGWSGRRAEDASAIQVPPAPLDAAVREFNKKLALLSGGLVPDRVDIDILTVGGSHSTTFLHQVVQGVRAVVPSISGSRLRHRQVGLRSPDLQQAQLQSCLRQRPHLLGRALASAVHLAGAGTLSARRS